VVTRLRFLPDILDSQDTVYFRSTNMPRTIGTLQEVIYGLYPTENTSNGTVPRLRLREPQDEDLMGNSYVCARLKELMLAFETGQNADLLLLENVLISS
jgi:acid phosphatase